MLNHPQSMHAPTIEVTLVHSVNTENCYCYYDFQTASLDYYCYYVGLRTVVALDSHSWYDIKGSYILHNTSYRQIQMTFFQSLPSEVTHSNDFFLFKN